MRNLILGKSVNLHRKGTWLVVVVVVTIKITTIIIIIVDGRVVKFYYYFFIFKSTPICVLFLRKYTEWFNSRISDKKIKKIHIWISSGYFRDRRVNIFHNFRCLQCFLQVSMPTVLVLMRNFKFYATYFENFKERIFINFDEYLYIVKYCRMFAYPSIFTYWRILTQY